MSTSAGETAAATVASDEPAGTAVEPVWPEVALGADELVPPRVLEELYKVLRNGAAERSRS